MALIFSPTTLTPTASPLTSLLRRIPPRRRPCCRQQSQTPHPNLAPSPPLLSLLSPISPHPFLIPHLTTTGQWLGLTTKRRRQKPLPHFPSRSPFSLPSTLDLSVRSSTCTSSLCWLPPCLNRPPLVISSDILNDQIPLGSNSFPSY